MKKEKETKCTCNCEDGKCNCGPECDCGCHDGKPCDCECHCEDGKDCTCNCDCDCDCGCKDGELCDCDCHCNDGENDNCTCNCHDNKDCTCECNCVEEPHHGKKAKASKLKAELWEQKAGEYLSLAQRIQADFENFRKRNDNLTKEAKEDGILFAAEKLLPIADSLSIAKKQIENKELLEHINVIYSQLIGAFSSLNIKKIDALNKPFNPNFHNAIMAEEVKGMKPDMITEEFQEGFMLGDKVLRHSVVKVSK